MIASDRNILLTAVDANVRERLALRSELTSRHCQARSRRGIEMLLFSQAAVRGWE